MRTGVLASSLAASTLLGVVALSSACLPDEARATDDEFADLAHGEALAVACRICVAPPPVRRWASRDPGKRLWPTTTREAVVVVTRGIRDDAWRGYGVDLSAGKLAFVFEGSAAEYRTFATVNVGEWTAGGAFDLGIDFGMAGSFKKPIPVPVGPIGQPPSVKALVAVETAAIDVLDATANMQAAM